MKKAILISCFDWYNERLKYIEEYLESKGYEVKVLLSDFSHIQKAYIREHEAISSIRYIHVSQYKKNISIQRLSSHYNFSKKVKNILQEEKPDLVYCLVPPNSLVKNIVKVKKSIGFKLIFDVIDLWPESFPKGNTDLLPFALWRNLRDLYMNEADKVVLECEYYKESLKNVDEHKLEVLRLIKQPMEKVATYEPYEEDICLGYLGSINSLIDIDRICQVIQVMSKNRSVRVRVVGDGEQRDEFIHKLEAAGASVTYYGKVFDEKQLQCILGNCNFGINIYKPNVKIGLTMKSVSYFQMGIPILNSIPGDTEELIEQYHAGINLMDKDMSEATLNNDIDKDSSQVMFDKEFSSLNIENRLSFISSVFTE